MKSRQDRARDGGDSIEGTWNIFKFRARIRRLGVREYPTPGMLRKQHSHTLASSRNGMPAMVIPAVSETKMMAPQIRFSKSLYINTNLNIVQGLLSHAIWPPQIGLVEEQL